MFFFEEIIAIRLGGGLAVCSTDIWGENRLPWRWNVWIVMELSVEVALFRTVLLKVFGEDFR